MVWSPHTVRQLPSEDDRESLGLVNTKRVRALVDDCLLVEAVSCVLNFAVDVVRDVGLHIPGDDVFSGALLTDSLEDVVFEFDVTGEVVDGVCK